MAVFPCRALRPAAAGSLGLKLSLGKLDPSFHADPPRSSASQRRKSSFLNLLILYMMIFPEPEGFCSPYPFTAPFIRKLVIASVLAAPNEPDSPRMWAGQR